MNQGDSPNEGRTKEFTEEGSELTSLGDKAGQLHSRSYNSSSLEFQILELEKKQSELLKELNLVYQSASWRCTHPLRQIRGAFKNRKRSIKKFVLPILFRLPRFINKRLIQIIAHLNLSQDHIQHLLETTKRADWGNAISWEVFETQVLSKRSKFRGVFIQEPVVDWNIPLFQRPQHMATALANCDFLVIYRTMNEGYDSVDGFQQIAENLWITNSKEVESIKGAFHSVYSTASAVSKDLQRIRENGTLVYEYIDHIDPKISGLPGQVEELNRIKESVFRSERDLIVSSASVLHEEVSSKVIDSNRITLIANGVDTKHYTSLHKHRFNYDKRFAKYKKFVSQYPVVVGYFGAIAPWLWYDLINKLTRFRSDIGFVFIGPDYNGSLSRLNQCTNVYTPGTIHYDLLPSYANLFDVCLIPFEPGEIAKTTSPLKLFEYFALKKPVVVTDSMNECIKFPEVLKASTLEGFSDAIDLGVRIGKEAEFQLKMERLALENDWMQRASLYTTFILGDRK